MPGGKLLPDRVFNLPTNMRTAKCLTFGSHPIQ